MDYQKALKRLTFFLNPVPLDGQNYQKQKGPGTSNQSLFRLQNKFRKIPVLVMYYLTKFDDIIQSSFWVTPKITSANLCKPVHDTKKYSPCICLVNLESVERKGKNYKKLNISKKKEKSFSNEIKENIFYSFWRTMFWWKNKNLIKNSRCKL